MEMINTKFNWYEIQKYYDMGHSYTEVKKHFNISPTALYRARLRKLFKPRTHKDAMNVRVKNHGPSVKKHSEKTKKKLSDIRIKFLTENPDKVPYVINHSSKKSWPEEVFENALKSFGIKGWIYKHRHGIYEYDFAFLDLKLDVEVDGGTHKTEKVKKIDKRRDEFSRQQGWKVLRFDAERVKKNVVDCIEELKKVLWNRCQTGRAPAF